MNIFLSLFKKKKRDHVTVFYGITKDWSEIVQDEWKKKCYNIITSINIFLLNFRELYLIDTARDGFRVVGIQGAIYKVKAFTTEDILVVLHALKLKFFRGSSY